LTPFIVGAEHGFNASTLTAGDHLDDVGYRVDRLAQSGR
jgi:hypothetical protein